VSGGPCLRAGHVFDTIGGCAERARDGRRDQLAESDTQAVWLLRQDRAVRESYVAEVIDGGEAPRER
jgi:hypothetical protein